MEALGKTLEYGYISKLCMIYNHSVLYYLSMQYLHVAGS